MNLRSYFVEIILINSLSPEFMALIPSQRKKVNKLMDEGTIVSYSLALDRSKVWMVMSAKDTETIMDVLASFPLIKFMKPDIHELAFHDNVHSGFPHLSLN
ncbi:MAG: muconolactone Delta-isomerase family protein [Bacteroidota bacterium]|nr:muconolactone Delta-isomerase family protein [Bacteroidota bacterium]